jgi:predicted nucleic acid-binding protein
MGLDAVRTGMHIFIDSNIFIYHFTGVSDECSDFLTRCESGELNGATSVNAILEVLHRLMMIEAVNKKLIGPPNIAGKLQKHPEKIKQLHEYYSNTLHIADMGIIIYPVSSDTILQSHPFRAKYGLMVNDSLIAACMRENGIKSLATNDAAFRKVNGLTIFSPEDVDL